MSQPNKDDIRRVVAARSSGRPSNGTTSSSMARSRPVFNKLYFPANDPFISTLLAHTTFRDRFVARPLGGLIFGHLGDRIGRKSVLVATLLIMGVATVLIGLLPTYQQIGITAPILLVVLRVFQGIGLGGEWGGAVLMAYEYARRTTNAVSTPACRRSASPSALPLVRASSRCLFHCPTRTSSPGAGASPSSPSILLVIVGLYIRLKVIETPEFQALKEPTTRSPRCPSSKCCGTILSASCSAWARYIDGVFFNLRRLLDRLSHADGREGCATASGLSPPLRSSWS